MRRYEKVCQKMGEKMDRKDVKARRRQPFIEHEAPDKPQRTTLKRLPSLCKKLTCRAIFLRLTSGRVLLSRNEFWLAWVVKVQWE